MQFLKHVYILFTIFCALAISGQAANNEAKIREGIAYIMSTYPEAHLADIYKSCFQDRFGPGHIAIDPVKARANIEKEIARSDSFPGPASEPTCYGGHFLRVNLGVVADGRVPMDTFFDAFIRSTTAIAPMPMEDWKEEWAGILNVIKDEGLDALPRFDEEESLIEANLAKGHYWGEHSDEFVKKYDIHYRIIEKEIFEKEILPLLEQRP